MEIEKQKTGALYRVPVDCSLAELKVYVCGSQHWS